VGRASLREVLELVAREATDVAVTVSAVGPIQMRRACADEIAAAVRQALDNVIKHARSSTAAVFAESEAGYVTVSIRDDGAGFEYDEDDLRARGKAGLLKSMKGRITDLDGTMTVHSTPGKGTEIEFRIPVESVT
jgi:signal transduction histidine kinase